MVQYQLCWRSNLFVQQLGTLYLLSLSLVSLSLWCSLDPDTMRMHSCVCVGLRKNKSLFLQLLQLEVICFHNIPLLILISLFLLNLKIEFSSWLIVTGYLRAVKQLHYLILISLFLVNMGMWDQQLTGSHWLSEHYYYTYILISLILLNTRRWVQ